MRKFWGLSLSAALAAGEYLAVLSAEFCSLAAVVGVLAVLVLLYGYAWRWRYWPLALMFLAGLYLGYRVIAADAERLRECPWFKGSERRSQLTGRDSNSADWQLVARGDLGRRLAIGLNPKSEGVTLNRAILLGERRQLSVRSRRLFVDSGAMHVFAISGLHVMAIAAVLMFLVRIFVGVPYRWAGVVAMPILWGYVLIIGSPPSAVRAAVMASLGALAPVCWRRANGLVAWSLTFIGVHLLNPAQIVNVGSVLSFAVMLAIQLTGDALRAYGRRWWTDLVVTFVAWAVGVPIAAHVFARVTPGGLVANLVLLTMAKWTVYTGALAMAASFFSAAVAAHLNGLSAFCTEMMLRFCEGVSRLPGGNLTVRPWPLGVCALWYAGILAAILIVRFIHKSRRRLF